MRTLLMRPLKRLRPREGWAILFMALAALACPSAALMQVTRDIGAERLLMLTVTAALIGLALARSRLPAGRAALVGALLGTGLLVVVLGRLLPPLSLLWPEAEGLMAWLQRGGWQQRPVAIPFPHATADFVWQRIADFGVQLGAWLHAVAAGEATDRIGFLLIAGLLAWGLSLFGSWQIFRRQAPIAGLLPSGTGVVLIVFLSGGGTMFLIAYMFCLLGLLAALHLWTRQQEWEQSGTDYPGDLGFDLAQVVLPWLAAILLMAGFFPVLQIRPASVAFGRLLYRPWSAVEQISNRLFGVIDSPYPGGYSPNRLPNEHLLSGGPEMGRTVVFYVKTNDPVPLPPEAEEAGMPATLTPPRYWRGVVYDLYTGHGWSQSRLTSRNYQAGRLLVPDLPAGSELRQGFEIVSAPGSLLYAANAPMSVDHPVRAWWRDPGDLAQVERSADQYTVISVPPEPTVRDLRSAPDLMPPDLAERYTALPDTVPQRVRDLAQQLTAGAETRYDRAKAIEEYLRTFTYTLDVPLPPPDRDVADYFLFELQKGFCDYYATAMVVMARAAGVPARYASGYAQGTYDFERERWQVTELNAHSWVEVYFEGIGWVEFEPTAGLVPIVRRSGEEAATPAGWTPETTGPAEALPWGLGIVGGILALLVAAIARLWRPQRRPIASAAGLVCDRYARLLTWGRRLGHAAKDGQTPYEYSATLQAGLTACSDVPRASQAGVDAVQLIGSFVRAQYGGEPIGDQEGRQIEALWTRLHRNLWWLWVNRLLAWLRRPAGKDRLVNARSRTGSEITRR